MKLGAKGYILKTMASAQLIHAMDEIAAGKVSAANIDEYLGYNHTISCDVEIPPVNLDDRPPYGRVELPEREASERKCDFEGVDVRGETEK